MRFRLLLGGRRIAPTAALAALALALALTVALFTAAPIAAHAELVESLPADGATLSEPPLEVTATFSEELVVARSSIQLSAPDGRVVAEGRVDPQEPTVLRLNPPASLLPGTYTVRWTAVAAHDQSVERSTFSFALAAPSPSPSPSPEASPSPGPAASPSPSAGPSPSPAPSPRPSPSPDPSPASGDPSAAVIPILVALVLLGGLGAWLLRRRRA